MGTGVATRQARAPPIASGSAPGDDGPQRPHHDLDVEPQRPTVDVLEIHPDPVVATRDPVAPAPLPQARDPGPHTQLALVPQLVALEVVRKTRPRAHPTNV